MNLKPVNVKAVIASASILAFVLLGGLLTFSQNGSFLSSSSDVTPPCDAPLTYRFGDIDTRFNISEEELANVMTQVEELWATALDKDLLDFDKKGQVVIHLVYSKEQRRTQEEKAFAKRIEVKEDQINVLEQEYNQFRERFENQRRELQSKVDEYNRLIETYNNYAGEWSGRNIPTHAKARLDRMEREISRKKSQIDREQQALESLRRQTNTKSQQLNALVEEQNGLIADYNNRFSGAQKFDQGRYVKKGEKEMINIFQFANRAQLKTVLAHEVGHAFGLSHVENPKSVMNKMMDQQNIFDLRLSEEDIAAITKRCSAL